MSLPAIRSLALLLAVLLATLLPAVALAAKEPGCPNLGGRYRAAADGPAQADLLLALQLGAGAKDEDLLVESPGAGVLTVQLLAARGPAAAPRALRTLFEGVDFLCRAGRVELRPAVPSARKPGEGAYLEGRSTVRLARRGDGALDVEVSFSGSERADLYRYESARISVPRPFSGRTLEERFAWLPAERVPVPAPAAAQAPSADTLREDEARVRLIGLLGRARVGFVKLVPGGVRVQLRASRSEEMVAAEDRLRAAGLPFEVEREPLWSGNVYAAELHLPDAPRAGAGRGRPSAFRVAAEINRLLPGGAHAGTVQRRGDAYIAEVTLQGSVAAQTLADSLAPRSPLLARVLRLPAEPGGARTGGRVERWLVTLQP